MCASVRSYCDLINVLSIHQSDSGVRAVFDGGVRGFDPPQEVVDPQRVLQNLFGGRL